MSFTAHFYFITNLCHVAQQNISFGWGRTSSFEYYCQKGIGNILFLTCILIKKIIIQSQKLLSVLVIFLCLTSCKQNVNETLVKEVDEMTLHFTESIALFQNFVPVNFDKSSGDTIEVVVIIELIDFENGLSLPELFIDGIQYTDDGNYLDEVSGDRIYSSIYTHKIVLNNYKNNLLNAVIVHKGSNFKFDKELTNLIEKKTKEEKGQSVTFGCDVDLIQCPETSWWTQCWPFSSPCKCVEFTNCRIEVTIE